MRAKQRCGRGGAACAKWAAEAASVLISHHLFFFRPALRLGLFPPSFLLSQMKQLSSGGEAKASRKNKKVENMKKTR
jgi:hypothetical protein